MKACLHVCLALIVGATITGCHRDAKSQRGLHEKAGDAYLAQKKLREAVVEYRSAVQADPNYGPDRLKLGDLFVQSEDVQNAFKEYIRAADLMPGNIDAQLKAGRALVVANQFPEAKARAEAALKIDPRSVAAQILLGNALGGLKDLTAAVEETEKAIAIDANRSDVYSSLAALQLARGDRQQAEAAFKRAVNTAPKDANAHLALANFYWVSSRIPEAETVLKQAYQLDPNNVMVNRTLAAFYVRTQQPALGEPYLAAIARLTQQPEAIVTLADYYASMGKWQDAKALLEKLAADQNAYGLAKAKLAALAFSHGSAAEAHQILDEVLKKEPRNLQALVLSAQINIQERKYDEAMRQAQAAVAADPRSVQAHLALGSAYRQRGQVDDAATTLQDALKADPSALNVLLQLAELEHMRGNIQAALQFAEQATKNEPRNPAARFIYGQMLTEAGEFGRAEQTLGPLLQSNPTSAPVHTEMGRLYLARKDAAAARREFDTAVQLDPAYVPALSLLIRLNARDGRARDSVASVQTVLSKHADDPRLWLVAAEAHGAAGDAKKQEDDLRKVLDLDPGNGQAYAMLGQLYASQHRNGDAIQQFEAWSARSPRAIAPLTMIGLLLESDGKIDEARTQYEKILSIDPHAIVASNNLAAIYAERGENLDVALRLAQTAKAAAPDNYTVNDTLGWILLKKGLPQDAISNLEPCVEKEPANALFQYHVGMAYAKNGDDAKAVTALKKALGLQPKFAGADEAKKTLAELTVLGK